MKTPAHQGAARPGVDNSPPPVDNPPLNMTVATNWSRAQALSRGVSPVESLVLVISGLLLLLVLLRSITGS